MSNPFAPAPDPPTNLGRYRILAPSCGLRVSPLCLGAMSIGDKWGSLMGAMSKDEAFKLLDAYYDNGGNFIDTANSYHDGESEEWIGEWMTHRSNRDEMVIGTKYTRCWVGEFNKDGSKLKPNYYGNQLKSMMLSVEASLNKLRTDYIDIFYLHMWDYTTPIEEVMQGLNNLVKSGKVLYLGISNTPAWIVSQANQYAKDHGMAQFVVYQGQYSVTMRDLEREIIPMCRAQGMALQPYRTVGGGRFQSKEDMEARKASGETLRPHGGGQQSPADIKISEALSKVAEEVGTKSVTAVALAYALHKYPYTVPVVGGRKVSHLLANVEATSISLTDAQITYLEAEAGSFDVGYPGNFGGTDPHTNGGKLTVLMGMTAQYSFVPAPKGVQVD